MEKNFKLIEDIIKNNILEKGDFNLNPLISGTLAYNNFKTGKLEISKEYLEDISEWFSSHPILKENDQDSIIYGVFSLLLSGMKDRGKELLQRFHNQNKEEFHKLGEIVSAYLSLSEKDYKTGFDKLNKILPSVFNNLEINIIMGFLDLKKNGLESALTYADRAIEIDKNYPSSYLLKSLVYFKKEDLNSSVTQMVKHYELTKIDTSLKFISYVLLLLEDIEESINYLSKIENKDEDYFLKRGYLKLLKGEIDVAQKHLEEDCKRGGLRLKMLGDIYTIKGDYKSSIRFYEEFLAEKEDDRTSRINLSQCYVLIGNIKKADEILKPLFDSGEEIETRAHDLKYKIDSILELKNKK